MYSNNIGHKMKKRSEKLRRNIVIQLVRYKLNFVINGYVTYVITLHNLFSKLF